MKVEFYLERTADLGQKKKWKKNLLALLKLFTSGRDVCLIYLYPSTNWLGFTVQNSVLEDFGQLENRRIPFSKKYQVIWLENVTDELLKELLEEAEFYLGYTVLAPVKKGDYQNLNTIANHLFSKELSTKFIDKEYLFMEDDGYLFCWTNPLKPEEIQSLWEDKMLSSPL